MAKKPKVSEINKKNHESRLKEPEKTEKKQTTDKSYFQFVEEDDMLTFDCCNMDKANSFLIDPVTPTTTSNEILYESLSIDTSDLQDTDSLDESILTNINWYSDVFKHLVFFNYFAEISTVVQVKFLEKNLSINEITTDDLYLLDSENTDDLDYILIEKVLLFGDLAYFD